MKKKIKRLLRDNGTAIIAWGAGIGTVAAVFLYRIGGYIRGDNNYETREALGVLGLDAVWQDIIYAPQKIANLALLKIDEPNVTLTRLLSAGIVLLSVIAFFLLIQKWHTTRVAVLATALFASSSYTLHLARFTQTETQLYLVIPLLLLFGTWLKSKRTVGRLPIALSASTVLLYIPGMLLSAGVIGYVFKKRLLLAWRFVSGRTRSIAAVLSALVLLPLLFALSTQPSQLTRFLGIDRLTEEGIRSALNALVDIPVSLFWNGPDEAFRWLVGTPVIDVGTLGLILIGVYAYIKGFHPLRARLLAGVIFLGSLLIATSSSVTIALIIPALYIVAAHGIALLLQQWFTVFPRNPIARAAGVVVCAGLILCISSYHIQRYFVAWPNATATEQALSPENAQL